MLHFYQQMWELRAATSYEDFLTCSFSLRFRSMFGERARCQVAACVHMPAQMTYDFTQSKTGTFVDQFYSQGSRNDTRSIQQQNFAHQMRVYPVEDGTLSFPVKISSSSTAVRHCRRSR